MIKIDKDVPLPETRKYRGFYPFEQMEVGDSFFIEDENRQRLASAVYKNGKRLHVSFSVRAEGKGFRVWRIK